MKINNFCIEKLIHDSDQFSHWTDHLTLNLKAKIDKLHDILSVLDFDNSNTKYEEIDWYPITYVKSISRNGVFINVSIWINGVPYPIFQYLEYPEKKKIHFNSEWSFSFYSTYFRLLERGDLDLSFEKVFFGDSYNLVKQFPISRIDYKCDFFFKGDYPFPDKDSLVGSRSDTRFTVYSTDKLKSGKSIIINKTHFKNRVTGWDLWSRWNKSVYLRMYDKLIDSKVKGKEFLYDDYFLFKNVYRLEWEFRTKFNKNLDSIKEDSPLTYMFHKLVEIERSWGKKSANNPRNYTYWELDKLEHLCMSYFCLLDSLTSKFIYQYKENAGKDDIDSRYFRDFWGRGCRIALKWWNPFKVLLNQFMHVDAIRKQISTELLETLLLDFNQHNMKLIEKWILFKSLDDKHARYKGSD